LQIESEMQDPGQPPFAVPTVHPADVVRETGYIAVSPAAGMRVETAEVSGISQIDTAALPEELKKESPALAYRYIRPDYRVAVNISEIQPEVKVEARTVATLSRRQLDLSVQLNYTVRRGDIFQLRLKVPSELRGTSVQGSNIDDTSFNEEKGILTVNLRNKVTDRYALTLQAEKALEEPVSGVKIPTVRAMDVQKERGFVTVVKKTSVRLQPAEGETVGLNGISVSDLPPDMLQQLDDVALAFKYFSQPWKLSLSVDRIEPRITADVFNLLSVGRELLTVSSTIDYSIMHAPEDTFTVKLPAGASAVDIDGEGIKQRQKGEEGRRWTITLQSAKEGSYTLYVSFERELAPGAAVFPYEGLEVLDVSYQTGYVALSSRPDVELNVAPEDVENLTPVDTREIPDRYLEGVTLPVLLSYRYASYPYTLRVGTVTHEAAEVTVAVIESAKLSTVITQEGNMVTDLVCRVRNSGRQQYLNLQLPEDASIWHTFVNGQPATPVSDGKMTKINIAEPSSDDGPIRVRVRYSDRRDRLGRMGALRIESPVQGIAVMRLGWILSLPRGYTVVNSGGPLKRLGGTGELEPKLQELRTDQVARGKSPQEQGPKKSAQAMRNVAAQQRVQAAGPGKASGASSIYTGSKPTQAASFTFQSLVVGGDESVWLQVQYVKESLSVPLLGVEVILLLLLCGLVWKWGCCAAPYRIAFLFACALITLAVSTLAEGAYETYLTTAYLTLLIASAAILVYFIVREIYSGIAQESEGTE
ncbi:MAG: hypothetical protein V5A84_03955, partial [Planctomycetota bacterium]